MRISDWSSDVCSSDLSPFDRPITRKFPPPNDQDPEGEDFALPSSGWEAMARGARGRCRARRRSPAASAACRARPYGHTGFSADRKSVVEGKRVSGRLALGGSRIIQKKKNNNII